MKTFWLAAHLRKETRRIERIIEEEFETIDLDAWKFGVPLSPRQHGLSVVTGIPIWTQSTEVGITRGRRESILKTFIYIVVI